ncbi:ribosome small subunit-dependent GTPase A [Bosea sp. (in: a-proteobacteria)]|uniref:ribosome small subunit-dependent GTPase A n=1 Tax=Bosea sp. (in: a-proteobacteria) TaxID=1871050 RepID=UPI0027353354|nr:ribosome small subunit-dependent GTPase A [Bosea sp. (in: a-proteobacteria)]MDP3257385.1 ribosome small subunit-dependent GTPase A [Bosea sp. (in: a-proteobacteria)]
MTAPEPAAWTLAALGWNAFFAEQCGPEDEGLLPARIATVHRSRMSAIAEEGRIRLSLPVHTDTGAYTVGDWVLVEPGTHAIGRLLERRTVLARRVEGSKTPQLAGANIDTLFIVTSCNADFNVARLERYLALANESGAEPVIILTKADLTDAAETYRAQSAALQRELAVVVVNPKEPGATAVLAPWCGEGRTVALVGSSGVGKSTLVNTLAGLVSEEAQETGGIRARDDKGRHTTTSRSLHAIEGGGWVIDTPGMRTLHVSDAASGLETLFAEITELTHLCRFRDCTHEHEPGCAVQAAVASGAVDPDRLARWRKLDAENKAKTPEVRGPRGRRR